MFFSASFIEKNSVHAEEKKDRSKTSHQNKKTMHPVWSF